MSLRFGVLRWRRGLRLGGFLLLSMLLTVGHAQVRSSITPDGTLGTAVSQRGTVFDITGGTRYGPNLFHSFDRFSVGIGDVARFTGSETGIKNILSRVTGGQRSDIDGQLRTDGPLRAEGAQLYLLNPAGVLFGPNATLDGDAQPRRCVSARNAGTGTKGGDAGHGLCPMARAAGPRRHNCPLILQL